jgi:beta-xylosidase
MGFLSLGAQAGPDMMYGDTSRSTLPFAKDPSVIRFGEHYFLYYSIKGTEHQGWAVGIAQSTDLERWEKVAELLPAKGTAEEKGIAAPGARVLDGKVHLFYQTYGNAHRDAICHAVSTDGIHFDRDPSNPIFHPVAAWNVGRAIDAEVFPFKDKLYLYYATRDPQMKVQMLGVASADLHSDFSRSCWTDLCPDGPILKPEHPWEQDCIEAPTICQHGDDLFMFYAGAYNNAPQQIGCAISHDAVHWHRISDLPLLRAGKPGEWNSSESGHPGVFVDHDGTTWLFFQGNNDHGKSWYLSRIRVDWVEGRPVIAHNGDK